MAAPSSALVGSRASALARSGSHTPPCARPAALPQQCEARLESEIKRAKTLEASGNKAGAQAAWDNVRFFRPARALAADALDRARSRSTPPPPHTPNIHICAPGSRPRAHTNTQHSQYTPKTHNKTQVEELSATASHLKAAGAGAYQDPLDKWCGDNPDADECRIYDD